MDCKIVRIEAAILLKVNHKNIIKLHQIYETKTHVILIFEKLSGGELFDRIVERGCFTEKDAAAATRQIVSALEYLHSQKITHRDLKPENLLYQQNSGSNDEVLKVADFGLSHNGGKPMATVCGTPGYVAPEIIKGKEYA